MTNLLRGSKVRLVALTADDAPVIARWYEDSDFMRLFDARPAYPKTEAELRQWVEESHQDQNAYLFGIRALENDALVGTLEIDGIIWAHRVCGTGLAIGHRADWGKGYGTDASLLGLRFAFGELNLHRVTITVFSYNERSIALVERLGFQREGTFREFLERDGRRYDMLLYGMLRHEWRERQAEDLTPSGDRE
jgi:RimJ/RimL family protein N-acetyltransferase